MLHVRKDGGIWSRPESSIRPRLCASRWRTRCRSLACVLTEATMTEIPEAKKEAAAEFRERFIDKPLYHEPLKFHSFFGSGTYARGYPTV